jgi:hypothetical protein
MSFPEDIRSVGCQASVKGVLRCGSGERRMSGNHDEKDDGCGKNVDRLTLVWLL